VEVRAIVFPGGMIDPRAYAPLLAAAAERGTAGVLIRFPRRGAFGGADANIARALSENAMNAADPAREMQWLIAGHSLGGAVAAAYARDTKDRIAGLLLIATTHPRDFSLASVSFPVVRILGSLDRIASPERSRADLLPPSATHIVLEGANHSQFGWYGFQPLDRFAVMPRDAQQRRLIEETLAFLARLEPSA
jgi:pimeloyl-ACP methyl ester carboxylesterase